MAITVTLAELCKTNFDSCNQDIINILKGVENQIKQMITSLKKANPALALLNLDYLTNTAYEITGIGLRVITYSHSHNDPNNGVKVVVSKGNAYISIGKDRCDNLLSIRLTEYITDELISLLSQLNNLLRDDIWQEHR